MKIEINQSLLDEFNVYINGSHLSACKGLVLNDYFLCHGFNEIESVFSNGNTIVKFENKNACGTPIEIIKDQVYQIISNNNGFTRIF